MPAGSSPGFAGTAATDATLFKKPAAGVRSHGHDVRIRGARMTDF